jgi:glycosyltransferase involved in cell wall biosynthesis
VVLVGLQDSRHAAWQQRLLGRLAPNLVCVQSPQNRIYLEERGCRAVQVPSGVDLTTFQPVSPERSRALRDQYGLPVDRPIVLHVGHLQRHRGVGVLAQLAAHWPGQVVLVASSSTRQEADLADELRSAGVAVFADFQPHVEHFYQLADAYLFPVQSSMNSIAVPLSVLEALACDLPVATTRFGGLTSIFGNVQRPGLLFADDAAELIAHARSLAEQPRLTTRPLVEPFSWEAIADTLLSASTGGTPTAAFHAAASTGQAVAASTTQVVAAALHGVDEMTSTVPMHR